MVCTVVDQFRQGITLLTKIVIEHVKVYQDDVFVLMLRQSKLNHMTLINFVYNGDILVIA